MPLESILFSLNPCYCLSLPNGCISLLRSYSMCTLTSFWILKPKWCFWNAKLITYFSYLTFPVAFILNSPHSPARCGCSSPLPSHSSTAHGQLSVPLECRALPASGPLHIHPSPSPFHGITACSSCRSQLRYHFLWEAISHAPDELKFLARCCSPAPCGLFPPIKLITTIITWLFIYLTSVLAAPVVCKPHKGRSV